MSEKSPEYWAMKAEIERLKTAVSILRAEPRRPLGPRGSGGAGTDKGGEHQYMVHMQVTDNQDGYDFVRAHPIGVSGATNVS